MSDARRRELAFVPYVAVGVLQIVSKVLEHVPLDRITRPLLMPTLALPVLLLLRQTPTRTFALLLLGVSLSWLGDLTLGWFIVGLSCFLLAHAAYLAMLRSGLPGPTSTVALAASAVWWLALIVALWPHLGPLALPVAVYGLTLVTMAAFATRGGVVVGLGGWCFVLSDSGLAFRTFTPWLKGHVEDVVIMGLYVVAQALIVIGMLRLLEARRSVSRRQPGAT